MLGFPLRYRGYVYDQETGLYYLQSRYYNPAMGRFINADALVSTGQSLLGNNMFAYCLNNPITYADSSGMLPLDNNRFRSHTTLNGGGNLCDGGISGVVRGEQPDWMKALDPANQDERVVLEAEYFAFYQGALVIRIKGNQGHRFSVGVIVLDDYYGYDEYGIQTLTHEYGHTLHCRQLGLKEYLLKAGIPSVIGYILDTVNILPEGLYYNLPWEHIADMFGNVSRSTHLSEADATAIIYWFLTLLG